MRKRRCWGQVGSALGFGDAATLKLAILYESQIEGRKHQDNTDVRHQPFPESIPKEEQIYTNYYGYQHANVEPDKHTFCHFSLMLIRWNINREAFRRRLLSFDTDTDFPRYNPTFTLKRSLSFPCSGRHSDGCAGMTGDRRNFYPNPSMGCPDLRTNNDQSIAIRMQRGQ